MKRIILTAFLILLASPMLVRADYFVYQENATEISYSGNWVNASNTYDDNWSTFGTHISGDNYLHVNYTIPDDVALNETIWQVKDGGALRNFTIDPLCSAHDNKLVLRVYITAGGESADFFYACREAGVSWRTLGSFAGIQEDLYEEAIYWAIPTTNISDCANLNVSEKTYYLTADITNSASSSCMNITADNVILDCQGYTIDGTDTGNSKGIYNNNYDNVKIKNCILTDWDKGIEFASSSNNELTNITVSSNGYAGMHLQSFSSSVLSDITANSNGYGILLSVATSNTFTDMTFSSNSWAFSITSSSNHNEISNYKSSSDGYGVIIESSSSNNTLTNSTIEGASVYGMILTNAGATNPNKIYNNLFNNTVNANFGGTLYTNYWNTTKQSIFTATQGYTLQDNATTVAENIVNPVGSPGNAYDNNWATLVYTDTESWSYLYFNYTKLENATSGSLWQVKTGVSDTNYTIPTTCFALSTIPFRISFHGGEGRDNNGHCYNGTDWISIYDGTPDAAGSHQVYEEAVLWNTTGTITTDSRIYSDGTYIGGNYWTNSASNGYSDTCTDSDYDGFCDDALNLTTNNVDYLAYSDEYSEVYLSIVWNYSSVIYGSLTHNTNNNTAPNVANGIYNVTINTNNDFKLEGNATDFVGGSHSFYVGNLTVDSDTSAGSLAVGNGFALSGSPQTIDTNIPSSTTGHYHGFWLSIPNLQYATNYNSTVSLYYSSI